MISVGIKDLKNQLSRYLQYVKRGERVLVTEHNRVIAEISMPREGEAFGVEEQLEQLAVSGKLKKAARNRSATAVTPDSGPVDWIGTYRENRDAR